MRIILMSAAGSNSLTGLLMAAPVLYKTSGTARDYLKEYFLTKMDISNYIIKIGVPPALTGLATLLLASWVLAYIIQLSQY